MKTTEQKSQSSESTALNSNKQTSVNSILQAYKKTTQFQKLEEEEPLQRQTNNTGLPDNLKSGIENLSGYSMDDVKVHYNSSQPANLQAHAYAQGTDIHVAPGQEKHLPHEAWHVVQQKQGRVKPTRQMKGSVPVNDDAGLEKEADVIGAKALQRKTDTTKREVTQMFFTNNAHQQGIINNYQNANNYWLNAFNAAGNFVGQYANDHNFSNIHMENNMLNKSIKASTTIAGESFEPLQWQQMLQNNQYIGPGGQYGTDLKIFSNSNHHLATGAQAGEVKSSIDQNWRNLFNGVNPQIEWIAYLAGPALINAQNNQNPNGRYKVYDKNNPNNLPFNCN